MSCDRQSQDTLPDSYYSVPEKIENLLKRGLFHNSKTASSSSMQESGASLNKDRKPSRDKRDKSTEVDDDTVMWKSLSIYTTKRCKSVLELIRG